MDYEHQGEEAIVSVTSKTTQPQSVIHDSTFEPRDHTVKDFLNRVYVLDSFEWSLAEGAGDVLRTYRFPDVLLSQPAIAAKLRNFFGLRAGIQFIVLVNRQPFQAGNLLISYLPAARYNTSKTAMAQISLPTRTGMTRTNLDLMSASVAELTVPYVSPHVYYNLLTGEGTIGDFIISVYSPLSDVAGTGTVSIQVQARFVDPDPEFPTGSVPTTLVSPLQNILDSLSKRITVEQLKEMKRIVNKMLKKEDIVLQMNDDINTMNVKPIALPNMSVTNVNNSHVLSLFSKNVLPPLELGGNSGEMDICKIVQIPCYHDSFSISNQAANTSLWVKQVTPLVPASTNDDGSSNVDYVYFHAVPFSKWASSFKYIFRVVKTRFHSLRLRVWFSPASLLEDGIDRNSTISKIIDLKEQNEFEFEVPYIWPHPMLNVYSNPQSLGIIGVDIVNPMVFPDTVSNTINVIVERAAGPDFKVNLPAPLRAFPTVPTPIATKVTEVESKEGVPLIEYDPIVPDLVDIVPYNNLDPHKLLTENIIRSGRFNDVTNAVKYGESLSKEHANALNWLSSFDQLNASSLILPIGVILKKIQENKVRILNKRSENSFVKDLTTEGIESNPGPTETLANFVSETSTTRTITSTLTGPLTIQIQTIQYLDTSDVLFISFSGDYTSQNIPVGKSFSYIKFDYPGDTPSITFTQEGTFQGGFAWVVITFSNDLNSLSIDGTVDTNISNTPLPVTTSSEESSIVTKTSITLQMNTREQDEERKVKSFSRPTQSLRADQACLGQTINNIGQMFKRSGLVATLTNVASNQLVSLAPHMFGLYNSSASNATDILSYYSSSYAFARGGINLRLVSAPDYAYNFVLGGDDFYGSSSSSRGFTSTIAAPAFFNASLGGALQQVIKPDLEGFGEITIPFYSDSYMYYIDNIIESDLSQAMTQLSLPYTTSYISPLGNLSSLKVYRAASSDFEMSFLTGPPILTALTN